LALIARSEQPAIFNSKNAAGNAAFLDEVDHLRCAHSRVETSLEIGAAQLDRVIAGLLRGIERSREWCRVDGPHVQGKTPESLRHSLQRSVSRYCPSYCRI